MKQKRAFLPNILFFMTITLSLSLTLGVANDSFARLIDESFEADPGYDESWTETLQGGTLNPDIDISSLADTPPPGAGSQCLESHTTAANYKAFALRTIDRYQLTYTRVYVYVDSESLENNNVKPIFRTFDEGNLGVWILRLYQASGNVYFQLRIFRGSTGWANYRSNNPISLDTWYRVEIKYDVESSLKGWEWRIDGVDQPNGSLSATGFRYGIKKWSCGLSGTNVFTGTLYYDLVAVDVNDWVGEETPDPGEPIWENFESSYDQLGWVEVTDTGGTLTAGALHPGTPPPVGPPPPGGSGIRTLKAVTNAGSIDAYAEQTKVDVYTSYVRCYLYLDQDGFSNDQFITAVGLYSNDGTPIARLQMGKDNVGQLRIRYVINSGGIQTPVANQMINVDQWYYVDAKYDINTTQWNVAVDGGQASGTFTAAKVPNKLRAGAVAETGTAGQCVLYTDYVAWSNKQISYYVDKDGGTPTSPWDTWAKAEDKIMDAITRWENNTSPQPGTIVVRKGATAYQETGLTMKNNLDIVSEDPSNRPGIHRPSGGPAVGFIGPLDRCTLDGFRITGGLLGNGGQINIDGNGGLVVEAIIQNCEIEGGTGVGPTGAGMRLVGAVAPTIRYTEIYNSYSAAIAAPEIMAPVTFSGEYITIQGCKIHDAQGSSPMGGAGIYLWGDNNEIKIRIGGDGSLGNDIYSNNQAGIRLQTFSANSHVIIDNNNIYDNGRSNAGAGGDELQGSGIWLELVKGPTTITRNNIHDNTRAGILVDNDCDVMIGAAAGVDDTIENIQSLYGNTIYSNFAGISLGRGYEEGMARPEINGTIVIRGNDIFAQTDPQGSQRAAIALRAKLASGSVLIRQNKLHDNDRGGIGIQHDYSSIEIVENNIYNNTRGGIHTGVANSFKGTDGGANVVIKKNRVHHNISASYGGGIDVRHASGNIENNIVYANNLGGIRFGPWIDVINNNTVDGNGHLIVPDPGVKGGGIILDSLDGGLTDPPSGYLGTDPEIKYNIITNNAGAGLRVGGYSEPTWAPCPGNPTFNRDYNLLYANHLWNYTLNGGTGGWNDPDCGWYQSGGLSYIGIRSCGNQQYGGCGTDDDPWPPPLPWWPMLNPHDVMADPDYVNRSAYNYHLNVGSPAGTGGYFGSETGAYGGSDPMNDDNIPTP